MTVRELEKKFDYFNNKFFGGELVRNFPIKLTNLRVNVGLCKVIGKEKTI